MRKIGHSRDETLHELPAVFINQMVALWWQDQGIEVELLSTQIDRETMIEAQAQEAIERNHSWL